MAVTPILKFLPWGGGIAISKIGKNQVLSESHNKLEMVVIGVKSRYTIADVSKFHKRRVND